MTFFNTDNQLSAFRVDATSSEQIPIIINSSDPAVIKEQLGCDPDERFTFYDQARITGTDIKQHEKAKALVLVSRKNFRTAIVQGSLRMRDLVEGNQSIEFITSEVNQENNLNAFISEVSEQEKSFLKKEHFQTAFVAIKNHIRADLFNKIKAITGDNAAFEKHRLLQCFSLFFMDTQKKSDLFELYGNCEQYTDTKKVLEVLKNKITTDWNTVCKAAGITLSDTNIDSINTSIDKVIEATCKPGVCESQQLSRVQQAVQEVEVEKENEKESEKETEVFVEKETFHENFDHNQKPLPYINWGNLLSPSAKIEFLSLTEICKQTNLNYSPVFSPNLLVSSNFYQTYAGETSRINLYSKPIHALLFRQQSTGLVCTLITQDEFNEIEKDVEKFSSEDCWISTTQHNPLRGRMPADIINDHEYQSLVEQCRFFNGEFNLLHEQTTPLHWLNKETTEKVTFFIDNLAFNCEGSIQNVNSFFAQFSLQNQLVTLILESQPLINRPKIAWKNIFHELSKKDKQELQWIDQLFRDATHYWWQEKNDATLFPHYNLTLNTLSHLDTFLKTLYESDDAKALHALVLTMEYTLQHQPQDMSSTQKFERLTKCKPSEHSADALFSNSYLSKIFKESNFPIPFNPNELALVVLACNPSIQRLDVKMLLQKEEPILFFALLKNPRVSLEQEELLHILESSTDKRLLMAIATNPRLTDKLLNRLLLRIENTSLEINEILTSLLNKSLNLSIIQAVFSEAHRNNLTPLLFIQVISNCDNHPDCTAILNHLVNFTTDTDIQKAIIKHPQLQRSNDAREIILNPFIATINEPALLAEIAAQMSLLPSEEGTEIRKRIVQNSFTPASVLNKIAATVQDEQVTNDLINHPNSNESTINALLQNNVLSDKQQKRVKDHNVFNQLTNDVLKQLVDELTVSDEMFRAVIFHPNIDDLVVQELVSRAATPVDILEELVGNQTTSSDVLHAIYSHENTLEPTRSLIINHPNINPVVLAQLAKITTEPNALLSILKTAIKKNGLSEEFRLDLLQNKLRTKEIVDTINQLTDNSEAVKNQLAFYYNHELFANQLEKLKQNLKYLSDKANPLNSSYDKDYLKAHKQAKLLIISLETAKNKYFSLPGSSIESTKIFKDTCDKAIKTASIELKQHRGFWYKLSPILRGLIGIIACVTIIPALVTRQMSPYGVKNTFFDKPMTKAEENLTNFSKDIKF